MFSCPFSVKIEEVPENLQTECIDLQCSSYLREKFKDFPLLEFYKKYVSLKKNIRGFTDWQFSWPHYSAALTCASKFFRGWTMSNPMWDHYFLTAIWKIRFALLHRPSHRILANLLEKNSAKLHIEMSTCSKNFIDFTVGMFIVLIIVKEDNTHL